MTTHEDITCWRKMSCFSFIYIWNKIKIYDIFVLIVIYSIQQSLRVIWFIRCWNLNEFRCSYREIWLRYVYMPVHYISTIFHRYYSSYHHLFPCGDCVTVSFTLRRYPQFSNFQWKSQYMSLCMQKLIYIRCSSVNSNNSTAKIYGNVWKNSVNRTEWCIFIHHSLTLWDPT